jgi:hypothetical protein
MIFSCAISGIVWQTALHMGHFFLCFKDFAKQTLQNECPQLIDTGSQIKLRHNWHSKIEVKEDKEVFVEEDEFSDIFSVQYKI